jgi:intracellular sulfur oxidation DsrE/DsrF family protein
MSATRVSLARRWFGGGAAWRAGIALALAAMVAFPAVAQTPAAKAPAASNPFAEHHLVLQLSDRDPEKQALVISVAYNLLKYYGPDKIAIEVVTYGPGIDLLRAENPNRALVDSLVTQGVVFDVCMNTVETIERKTGKHVDLNPKTVPVEAGVAQILLLTEKGYTLVRP